MRSILLLAASSAGALFLSCAHPAYGPSSDQRLESATSNSASTDGSDVAAIKCGDLRPKLEEAQISEAAEGDRLQKMVEVFVAAKERSAALDEAVARNPDLLYSASADTIKTSVEECRSFFADVRSDLDRFVRDVTDLPVIKEIQGNRDVARIDFSILRDAIATLDPDDKDALLSRVESAERKVSKPAESGAKTGRKR